MERILNLTQHPASADQIAAGVVDLTNDLAALKAALTFGELPNAQEIRNRVRKIADLAVASGIRTAMIGGAPWLMGPLAAKLSQRGITPLFAFSVRETEEQAQADGSVRKVAVFRHAGFIPAVVDPTKEISKQDATCLLLDWGYSPKDITAMLRNA